MTVFYSTELASIASTPVVKADATKGYAARIRRYRATITYASQTTSDTIMCAYVPAGMTFAFGVLNADTSSGSTTLAIGITGTTAKYKAAAAFTATDTPTLFGKTAQAGVSAPLTSEEQIFITLAAATAPASGTLVVDLYFTNG